MLNSCCLSGSNKQNLVSHQVRTDSLLLWLRCCQQCSKGICYKVNELSRALLSLSKLISLQILGGTVFLFFFFSLKSKQTRPDEMLIIIQISYFHQQNRPPFSQEMELKAGVTAGQRLAVVEKTLLSSAAASIIRWSNRNTSLWRIQMYTTVVVTWRINLTFHSLTPCWAAHGKCQFRR